VLPSQNHRAHHIVRTAVIPGVGVSFSCSEVKAVLEELLSDANNRIGEINKQLAQLREDVRNAEDAHDKAKDDLQDALEKQTDAAQELAKHDPLEIARLKGVWEQAELSLKQARIRYDTDRKRFDREREIIGKIMAKIDANCAGAATPKELTPAQEWEGRTLIGKRDTTIAAGECAIHRRPRHILVACAAVAREVR
jgi:chromosome segregation ATPase